MIFIFDYKHRILQIYEVFLHRIDYILQNVLVRLQNIAKRQYSLQK